MTDLLKDFPVILEIPIAWGEIDSLQHVNNIYYFRYFESVRILYLEKLNVWTSMGEAGVGATLRSTQCRFKIPLTYPDIALVGARVIKVEDDRFTMEYRIVSQRLQKIAAEGEGIVVAYDHVNKKKTHLSEELKQRISEMEGGSKVLL